MKRCSASGAGITHVQSDSSSKIYVVTINASGVHHCTCPAWAIQTNKRKKAGNLEPYNCKHIMGVLQSSHCSWTSDHPTKQEYPEICPLCFSSTEYFDDVLEDPGEEQMNDTLAGLLALRQRLTS